MNVEPPFTSERRPHLEVVTGPSEDLPFLQPFPEFCVGMHSIGDCISMKSLQVNQGGAASSHTQVLDSLIKYSFLFLLSVLPNCTNVRGYLLLFLLL